MTVAACAPTAATELVPTAATALVATGTELMAGTTELGTTEPGTTELGATGPGEEPSAAVELPDPVGSTSASIPTDPGGSVNRAGGRVNRSPAEAAPAGRSTRVVSSGRIKMLLAKIHPPPTATKPRPTRKLVSVVVSSK